MIHIIYKKDDLSSFYSLTNTILNETVYAVSPTLPE